MEELKVFEPMQNMRDGEGLEAAKNSSLQAQIKSMDLDYAAADCTCSVVGATSVDEASVSRQCGCMYRSLNADNDNVNIEA